MSLFTRTASRYSRAQRTLARLQGFDPTESETNCLIAGAPYLGVFGSASVSDAISAAGGYRRVAMLPLTVTRAQLAAPPASKTKVVRTDISPTVEYLVDSVDIHDPHHYTLLLVKNGE